MTFRTSRALLPSLALAVVLVGCADDSSVELQIINDEMANVVATSFSADEVVTSYFKATSPEATDQVAANAASSDGSCPLLAILLCGEYPQATSYPLYSNPSRSLCPSADDANPAPWAQLAFEDACAPEIRDWVSTGGSFTVLAADEDSISLDVDLRMEPAHDRIGNEATGFFRLTGQAELVDIETYER